MTKEELLALTNKATAAVQPPPPAADSLQFYSLESAADAVHKLIVFGHSGTGKTYLLSGPILCGERVLSLCTDFGCNGINTLRNLKPALPEGSLRGLDFSDYESFMGVLSNPQILWDKLGDWIPTILHWEGLSNFQLVNVDEYVLGKSANYRSDSDKISELRTEGLWAEQTDWAGIKRATMRAQNKFLNIHHPTRRLHKVVSALESGKPVQDKLTQQIRRAPLLQGAAESLLAPGYDLILETFLEDNAFKYRCKPGGGVLAKNRGYDVPDVMDADPVLLWKRLQEGRSDAR